MIDLLVSIIVYGFTALILYSLAREIANKDRQSLRMTGKHAPMWISPFILSVFLFAVVAGARYNTGVDHLHYLEQYNSGGDESAEIGFYMISHFLSAMGIHFFFYFGLWAALQITFVYLSFRHRRELLPYVALMIMLGPYFLDWMNGIRQSIVVCFFLYIVSGPYSRKTIKSFIFSVFLVLMATTIHRSAVVLVALLTLGLFDIPLKNRVINLVVVVSCLFIGSTPSWINMNSAGISEILAYMGYDHYSMIYETMVEMADFKETAFGPLRIMTLAVDLIVIWSYPKVKNYYAEDGILSTYFLFFFLGVCAYNLFANTDLLFLRPISYLTIFRIPMIAYTLCYLKRMQKSWFYITCVLVFTYTLIEVLKSGLLGIKPANLYHFFFFS